MSLSFQEPDGVPARGTVVVVPGRGEQPEVYRRFGTRIAFDAYRVSIVADPTLDADRVIEQIRDALSSGPQDVPVAIAGSDTGALFAAALVSRQQFQVDGLILAGLPLTQISSTAKSWEDELDARTTCPTHRAKISEPIVTRGALYEPAPADWLSNASLELIEKPILGLHGRADPFTVRRIAGRGGRRLGGGREPGVAR